MEGDEDGPRHRLGRHLGPGDNLAPAGPKPHRLAIPDAIVNGVSGGDFHPAFRGPFLQARGPAAHGAGMILIQHPAGG